MVVDEFHEALEGFNLKVFIRVCDLGVYPVQFPKSRTLTHTLTYRTVNP